MKQNKKYLLLAVCHILLMSLILGLGILLLPTYILCKNIGLFIGVITLVEFISIILGFALLSVIHIVLKYKNSYIIESILFILGLTINYLLGLVITNIIIPGFTISNMWICIILSIIFTMITILINKVVVKIRKK